MKIAELLEKRGRLVTEAREIITAAESGKRDMTDEERAKHGQLLDEAKRCLADVDVLRRQEQEERSVAEAQAAHEANARDARDGKNGNEATATPEQRQMVAFGRFLRGSNPFVGEGAEEMRNLQAGSDTDGGFIVAPEQVGSSLVQALDAQTFVRASAMVVPAPNAVSLGVPTLDSDPDDADWTTELETGAEDDGMKLGKRSLTPHPLAKRIRVSRELTRVSSIDVVGLTVARLAYKFGIAQEKGFLVGDGNNKPLGLFVSSDKGIPASRNVAEGNTQNAITLTGLQATKYSLRSGYRSQAEWLFHTDAIKQIASIKDGDGRFIWQPSVVEGQPDKLLGRPFHESEFAPNAFTAGSTVGLFGDLSYYMIADAIGALELQRLDELYATTNQIGFIGRQHTDGMPILAEAFSRVALAA